MTRLDSLIAQLKKAITDKSSFITTIKHPQLLVNSLIDLRDTIGNNDVKEAVSDQLYYLIMEKHKESTDDFYKSSDTMLHSVLYGPPGVGKTTIGCKLARIWYSLGFIKGAKKAAPSGLNFNDLLGGDSTSGSSDFMTPDGIQWVIYLFVLLVVANFAIAIYDRMGVFWSMVIFGCLVFLVVVVIIYSIVSSSANKKEEEEQQRRMRENLKRNILQKIEENKDSAAVFEDVDFPPDDKIFKIAKREDFVGEYVGWTSPKTSKLLNSCIGKVLFIDEAYSLINGPNDQFGLEALTTLNQFMSEHASEIIVIFAGYRDLLEKGVFREQPGLQRRCMWKFNCSGYNPEELFQIYKYQANKVGWSINDESTCIKYFKENYDAFPAYGGDTERAFFFAKLAYSRDMIAGSPECSKNTLTPKHLLSAIKRLRSNHIESANSNLLTDSSAQTSDLLQKLAPLLSGYQQQAYA